jgi:hypothetical protein
MSEFYDLEKLLYKNTSTDIIYKDLRNGILTRDDVINLDSPKGYHERVKYNISKSNNKQEEIALLEKNIIIIKELLKQLYDEKNQKEKEEKEKKQKKSFFSFSNSTPQQYNNPLDEKIIKLGNLLNNINTQLPIYLKLQNTIGGKRRRKTRKQLSKKYAKMRKNKSRRRKM